MDAARRAEPERVDAVRVTNRDGASPFVLICDHASNFIPPEFGTLRLDRSELSRHIAWDPGALPVARTMARALDAVLVESCISRLVIDCNRPLDAPDLIPSLSETTTIPGNVGLSEQSRSRRVQLSWTPFHDAIESVVADRLALGRETRLVSVHSFTPLYKGFSRPWEIGIIHDDDQRLSAPMIDALRALPGLTVGVNEPYSPADRVYYTLERHARSRNLPCAMIEIRNDEIKDEAGQLKWALALTDIFENIDIGIGSGTPR